MVATHIEINTARASKGFPGTCWKGKPSAMLRNRNGMNVGMIETKLCHCVVRKSWPISLNHVEFNVRHCAYFPGINVEYTLKLKLERREVFLRKY